MNKEDRIQVLQMINEWVRFADAKAGAVSGLNGVILTIILSQYSRPSLMFTMPSVIFNLGLVLIVISLAVGINAIIPRLNGEGKGSNIFFEHIAKFQSSGDYVAALNDPSYNIEDDISSQSWNNSKVAVKKYESINSSIMLALTGYGFIVFWYFLQG